MPKLIGLVIIAPLLARSIAEADSPTNAKDPAAVKAVLAGERTTANAAWWGFDEEDATDALQSAIDSGGRKVIVPNMGRDWNVRPIELRGDQELVFEDGVVVTAKRGEYQGRGDCVFTASGVANLTIRGHGATVRMHKEDYIVGTVLKELGWHRWYGQYEKAEWRTTLALRGCTNVKVYGLTLRDSGGDGIYIDGGSGQDCCRNVLIKDVVCDNNYRQGISIISVDGLLVEESAFNNTWGTPPSSGVDIEPDGPEQKLKSIVFRKCRFEDNYGDGIEVFTSHLRRSSDDISVLFDDCYISSRRGAGIRVTKLGDDGPNGLIEFRDCVVENTEAYGIKVQDKSAERARVRFVDCTLRDVANDRAYHGTWTPIWLHPMHGVGKQSSASSQSTYAEFGGIDFIDCTIKDDHDRDAIAIDRHLADKKLADITGTITVDNPQGVRTAIDEREHNLSLVVKPAKETPHQNAVINQD